MNIDIRNFVDINIVHHAASSATSTREVTVLFTDYQIADDDKHNIYSSYSEIPAAFKAQTDDEAAINYARVYFHMGGKKLHIVHADISSEEPVKTLADNIKELPDEEIVIAYPASTASLVNAIETLNNDSSFYGVKVKLAVARTAPAIPATSTPAVVIDGKPSHVIAKYSSKGEVQACIAAYLSKIDVNKINSIKDYDYTVENLLIPEGQDETLVPYYEDEDNAVLESILENDENVDMRLAGQIRNIGGNTKDGNDLVNEFMLIVLQQTVSERVLSILTDKLKGESGVAAIHTAIAQELQKYVSNGYLTTDKVWMDEALTITYNGVTYTVIEQNTPLLLGYQIKILPYSSLTPEDKAKHKTPPIYLVIADSYHIRHVAISGEVY